jgi:hypothetical protein
MTQFKAGISRLPNKNIFENVIKTRNILTMEPKPLSDTTSFFLTVAADIVCNEKKKRINKRKTINWDCKVKNAATYDQNYGLMKEAIVVNMINRRLEERQKVLETLMVLKYMYPLGLGQYATVNYELNQIDYFDNLTQRMEFINLYKAKPCFLDEPLKNRSLSINTTPYQLFSRDLQSDLLDCWHDTKYSTMYEEALNVQIFQTELKDEQNGFFYSVDYSAATDYLNPNVTRCLLKRCIYNFPAYQQYEDFYLNSVDSKWIDMKKFKIISNFPSNELQKAVRTLVPDYMQTHGQMMGNNLSFPLLCMANLSTFLEAKYKTIIQDIYPTFFTEENDDYLDALYFIIRMEELDNRLIKINGDDAVAEITQPELVIQQSACKGVGLVINDNKSIGIEEDFKYRKNLFNINSRQFWYDEEKKLVTEIGYLNQRLLYKWNVKTCLKNENQMKYLDEVDLFTSHDSFVHQTCKGRNDLLSEMSFVYVHTHFKEMNEAAHPEMWNLHPNLGGKGMFDYTGKPAYYSTPNFAIGMCYDHVFGSIELNLENLKFSGPKFTNVTSPLKKWVDSHEEKLVTLAKMHNLETISSILKTTKSGLGFRQYTNISIDANELLSESVRLVSEEFNNYDLSDSREILYSEDLKKELQLYELNYMKLRDKFPHLNFQNFYDNVIYGDPQDLEDGSVGLFLGFENEEEFAKACKLHPHIEEYRL